MTTTCTTDRKCKLYEHLRIHGWMPADESVALRREVYLMAWHAMPSAVKQQLARARAAFRTDLHQRLEREALRSLPPYQHLIH